jgi:hypothetical protein
MTDDKACDTKSDVSAQKKSGWEQHAKEQRRAWLETTPAERLAWLEDAMRFANQHRQQPR